MSTEDDSGNKKSEVPPGLARGQDFDARNLVGASDYSDAAEYRLIQWQKQVVADDDLDRTAKFILIAWGLESQIDASLSAEKGEPVRIIEPVPSVMQELTGIPESTYYRYARQVQSSRWLKNIGAFQYEAGSRTLTGIRYELVFAEGDN